MSEASLTAVHFRSMREASSTMARNLKIRSLLHSPLVTIEEREAKISEG